MSNNTSTPGDDSTQEEEVSEEILITSLQEGGATVESVLEMIEEMDAEDEDNLTTGSSQRGQANREGADDEDDLQVMAAVLSNHAMWDAIDRMNEEIENSPSENLSRKELMVQVVNTSGVGILAGVTVYALRGGALLASWFSTMPVWSTLDPLPVVGTRKPELEEKSELDEKTENRASRRRLLTRLTPCLRASGPLP